MKHIISSCIDKQITALESLKEVVTTPEYFELFDELDNCPCRIFISGVGKNSNIATKISESMASLGIKSGYMDPTNYLHGDGGFLEKNDSIVYITRSGKTDEILAMLRHVKINWPSIKQYLIHCNPEIKELPIWSLCLPNVVEGDYNELAPTTSTTTFLCFLDTITVALSHKKGFTKQEFLRTHPGGNLGNILREDSDV